MSVGTPGEPPLGQQGPPDDGRRSDAAQKTGFGRLGLLLGAVFVSESLFFSIIPPLIPQIATEAHLTTQEVGILVGAYPAGTIVASAASVAAVTKAGLQRITQLGALLLAVGTMIFAWSDSETVLVLARFVQGLGGGLAWAAGLSWLTSSARASRTGTIMGGSVGAALLGMLLGPLLGALGATVGRGLEFTALGVALIAVGLALPKSPPIDPGPAQNKSGILRSLTNAGVAGGGILLLATGVVSATAASLIPLLIATRHGGPATIAAVFVGSSVLGVVWSMLLGRTVDLTGSYAPTLVGFLLAAILMAVIPVIEQVNLLLIPAIAALSVIYALWTPIGARMILSSGAHASDHAGAVAIMNSAWALGASLGALAVTRVEALAGFEWAFIAVGALCALAGLTGAAAYRSTA